MNCYTKIQTVYFRDPENQNRTLIEGAWSLPEFEYLQNNEWVWTEKVDGTNIRVLWDGEKVRFGGRTDEASIPVPLLNPLADLFTPEKMASAFNCPCCLYGEGFGAKIGKGAKLYMSDRNDFILFDCRIGEFWLERHNLEDIASKLGIDIVPVVGHGTLHEAIDFVKNGFVTSVGDIRELNAEGLVLKPAMEMLNRKGVRVIAKIKHKDFKR